MKHILCYLAVLGLLLSGPLAFAGGKGKKAPTPPPKHTVVQMVSGDSITIDTGSSTKSFKLNERTSYTFHGQKVTKNEIKPGMRVSVTPGFDGVTASLVAVSDPPKNPPKAEGKK